MRQRAFDEELRVVGGGGEEGEQGEKEGGELHFVLGESGMEIGWVVRWFCGKRCWKRWSSCERWGFAAGGKLVEEKGT